MFSSYLWGLIRSGNLSLYLWVILFISRLQMWQSHPSQIMQTHSQSNVNYIVWLSFLWFFLFISHSFKNVECEKVNESTKCWIPTLYSSCLQCWALDCLASPRYFIYTMPPLSYNCSSTVLQNPVSWVCIALEDETFFNLFSSARSMYVLIYQKTTHYLKNRNAHGQGGVNS